MEWKVFPERSFRPQLRKSGLQDDSQDMETAMALVPSRRRGEPISRMSMRQDQESDARGSAPPLVPHRMWGESRADFAQGCAVEVQKLPPLPPLLKQGGDWTRR